MRRNTLYLIWKMDFTAPTREGSGGCFGLLWFEPRFIGAFSLGMALERWARYSFQIMRVYSTPPTHGGSTPSLAAQLFHTILIYP